MHIKRVCKICGAEYWTGNGKAKYCSDPCRREAIRRKQKEWREKHPDYLREWRSARRRAAHDAIVLPAGQPEKHHAQGIE